jgi:hypothetical protein
MQKAKGGYGYVVRSSIMERYFDENAGLRTKAG